MADTKISNLTDGSPLQSTDDIPVARSGTNRRVRINLADYATAAQGSTADTAVQPTDIDTLAELNALIADATLIDTGDSRLSDARTPTAHAASHATGGSDALTPAAIGAATAAQGSTADSAVQPDDLATVATTGAYADLSGTPTIPTTALPVGVVSVTASKTLLLTDSEKEQVCNSGSDIVVTIPSNASVAFAIGAKVAVLRIGAGAVTVTASGGVTLNGVSAGSAALTAQYSAAVLTKVGTDAWVLNGDHGAVA